MAVAATDENPNNRLLLRRVYVSDHGLTWRQISSAGAPKQIAGLAFAPDGALRLADRLGHRLLRVAPGRNKASGS